MSAALRLSLGANIVLIGLVAVVLWRDPPAASPSTASPARPVSPPADAPGAESRREAQPRETIGAEDPPAVLAQLEQIGISRDIFATAVLEGFNRRWDKRVAELERRYAPKPVPDRDYHELARLRDAEQVRELKAALGEEGYRAWDKERTLHALNGTGVPLTDEEAEQAYRLQKEFEQKHKELQIAMEDGVADLADGSTLQAQAQAELDRELEKLLGQQRLNAMRGLTDPAAEVYLKFGDLNPTPDQAKAALAAEADHRAREAALTQRLNGTPADAASVAAELKAIADARDENLRRIFGADAFAQAQRQNDPTYKTLQQYAEAWELKADEVQSVYETVHAFQDQAGRTRSAAALREAAGQPVNWQEINAAIEEAQRHTEAALQNRIGAERLRRLKQNGVLINRSIQ